MNIHTDTKNRPNWKNIFRLVLRTSWWLLKIVFKTISVIGAFVFAIFLGKGDPDYKHGLNIPGKNSSDTEGLD